MQRRAFIGGIAVSALAGPLRAQSGARTDWLRQGFGYLRPPMRRHVQNELKVGGFYSGAIDGQYGPATQSALIGAANHIRRNSRGQVRIDLTTQSGIVSYYKGLVSGELAAWLYGEGNECANGC